MCVSASEEVAIPPTYIWRSGHHSGDPDVDVDADSSIGSFLEASSIDLDEDFLLCSLKPSIIVFVCLEGND